MKSIISLIMVFFCAVAFGVYPESYTAKYDDTDLQFAVVSDIHMEGNNTERFKNFPKALLDINGSDNDALVMLGDNTMNGQLIEHLFLTLSLKLFNDIGENFIALGNHEVFTVENGYEKGSERFFSFAEVITGRNIDRPYYYDTVNGYYFIVMGSEADMGVNAYISAQQLEWLDETLAKADESGKPAFVFCHYPLEDTHKNAWPDGLMGEQSGEVYNILKSHKNVFFFSGHLHNSVDYSGVVQKDGVTFVDVPSLLSDNVTVGTYSVGIGYSVEVHGGCVELRPRNFISGEWLDGLAVTVELA